MSEVSQSCTNCNNCTYVNEYLFCNILKEYLSRRMIMFNLKCHGYEERIDNSIKTNLKYFKIENE